MDEAAGFKGAPRRAKKLANGFGTVVPFSELEVPEAQGWASLKNLFLSHFLNLFWVRDVLETDASEGATA